MIRHVQIYAIKCKSTSPDLGFGTLAGSNGKLLIYLINNSPYFFDRVTGRVTLRMLLAKATTAKYVNL